MTNCCSGGRSRHRMAIIHGGNWYQHECASQSVDRGLPAPRHQTHHNPPQTHPTPSPLAPPGIRSIECRHPRPGWCNTPDWPAPHHPSSAGLPWINAAASEANHLTGPLRQPSTTHSAGSLLCPPTHAPAGRPRYRSRVECSAARTGGLLCRRDAPFTPRARAGRRS